MQGTTRTEGVQTEPEEDWANKRPSVIEDWQHPSAGCNYVIKGDQLYEERAIDVREVNPPPDLIQRRDPTSRSEITLGNDHGVIIKIKKPQGGGTVRNIPIKDYQASIAANFGTLRKLVLPQQQFESLVSEPEKGLRLTAANKQRVNLIPRVQKSNLKMTQRSEVSVDRNAVPDPSSFGSRDTAGDRRLDSAEKYPAVVKKKDTRDGRENLENYIRAARSTEQDPVDLQRGHVVQKISVYEGNSREPRSRSLEAKRRRQLGVPLVGMHNACGLPVIAPWPTQVDFGPVETSRKIMATLRPLQKIPLAVPADRSRTNPKRRAPQHPAGQSVAFRSPRKFPSKSAHRVSAVGRDSMVSVPDLKRQGKIQKRPSFKVNKINTFPSRHFVEPSLQDRSARTTFRSVKGEAKRRSPMLGTFGRRSLRRGSAKRKTLYAKGDGDEAAKVLSTLCLNPLARSKEATNMIW